MNVLQIFLSTPRTPPYNHRLVVGSYPSQNANIHEYHHISTTDPSTHFISHNHHYNLSIINYVIRCSPLLYHQLLLSGLLHDLHVIQHMLRHNIILKVDDCFNITPLFSVFTYFIMNNTSFNVEDLLICTFKILLLL